MRRGILGSSLTALTILLTVTACGTANQTPIAPNSAGTSGGATQSGSAATNGTLNVGLTAFPITMDPLTSSAWFDRQIMFNVYDTLFQLSAQNQIEPDLVATYEISTDGKTYTFHLRNGVQFQDGTPFNAAAVKFNIERYQGKTSTSRSALSVITSVDTPNDTTVILHLSSPFSPLLSVFTDRAGMMASPTAIQKEGKDFGQSPVGTGPFMYKESVHGDHITLVKNPHYWISGEPKLGTVVFKSFSDPNVEYSNLQSGAVQIVDSVPPQQVQALQQNPSFTVISRPSWGWSGYGLNNAVAPFNNHYLREAVDEAVNRTAIVSVVLDGNGTPGYSAISPTQPGYDKTQDTPPQPNASTIKQLLAKGGQPNGFQFTLQTLPSDQMTAVTMQSMLAQYGIQMKIQQEDAAGLGAAQNGRDFQAILEGWSGRLDPDQNMSQYFYANGPLNWVGYNNPQADQLLTLARSQLSMSERQQTYAKLSALLHTDAPAVILYHKNNIIAYSRQVQGFPYRADGMIRAATISIIQ